jgi:polar amino acid transport system substrate-binding protein
MRFLLALVIGLTGVACGIPRDPEATLDRVTGGTLVVGVTESDPWTILEGDEPTGGVEVRLIEDFARSIDAEIEWIAGSEEELFGALELGELDLAIGGFSSTNLWSSKITFTHPYLTTFATVGVPEQDQVATDIAGIEVAVERGSDLAGLLRETDAVLHPIDDIADATGAAAVENWELDDLDLYDSDVRLKETDHVIAVRGGENAFLTALERFLLEREGTAESYLEEEGRL